MLEPDALAPSDPVRKRLYPAGYADPDDAEAFRELTESALQADRSERVDQCLAEAAHADGRCAEPRSCSTPTVPSAGCGCSTTCGSRSAPGWTSARTTTTSSTSRIRRCSLRARYLWLTALQDALVTTVMG